MASHVDLKGPPISKSSRSAKAAKPAPQLPLEIITYILTLALELSIYDVVTKEALFTKGGRHGNPRRRHDNREDRRMVAVSLYTERALEMRLVSSYVNDLVARVTEASMPAAHARLKRANQASVDHDSSVLCVHNYVSARRLGGTTCDDCLKLDKDQDRAWLALKALGDVWEVVKPTETPNGRGSRFYD